MGQSANLWGTHRSHTRGFSTVELAVSLCIMLILTSIAIPSVMRSLRTYQLNDSAARLSDMLKFTRFEAVRKNKLVDFCIRQNGTAWNVWTDPDRDGVMDPPEKQSLITGFVTLLPPSGLPSSATITATLGAVTAVDASKSGVNATITFDARGAVLPLNAYVIYLGNNTFPDYGYRAVILLPSGATQIWTAPPGGPWVRIG